MKTLFQKPVLGIAAIASTLVPTAAASAACTLADLKGSWRMYITDYTYNAVCPAVFNRQGQIVRVTTCKSPTDPNLDHQVEEGTLRLRNAATCLFTGVFKIGGFTQTVKSFTLSLDKTTAFGAGTYDNGPFEVELAKTSN